MIAANNFFRLIFPIVLVISLTISPFAMADWQPNPDDKKQMKAQAAIERFKEKVPRSASYFEQTYGFAILPSVTRVAIGFGGAYGKGLVLEGDNLIGKTGFWQFTSGLQAGAKHFSMIVFFKDKEALEYFKAREIQFAGQAGVDVATWGAAGTPAYNEGVAIITLTRLGLMGEFSYGGIKFTYKDLPQD
jgi:lipid-binding SYLF domain-containing protein